VDDGHARERFGLRAPVEKIGIGDTAVGRVVADVAQTIVALDQRESLEQDRVRYREDTGIDADTDGEAGRDRACSVLQLRVERLGQGQGVLVFLPGDMAQKVDPYLRPLYDALYDLMGFEKVAKLFERGSIEVAPLAYMRGRTLNHSFIILDEAQNTTPEQMKMFLTRIGFNSKVVVTGDMTQVDVQGGRSGLVGLEAVLSAIDGLEFVHLTSRDVVRHRIVQDIVDAYERHQK
jgi:hypothetical protein